MAQHDGEPDEIVAVGDDRYSLTKHAIDMMLDRGIEKVQVAEVLSNWVAREINPEHRSTGYFGFVTGRSQLLMVSVSEGERSITTVHFDSTATRHYRRGDHSYFDHSYLDEVNNGPESRV